VSGSVKVPGEWFERDDVEAIGAEAAMLHLSALAFSARQLTDGRISNRQLRRLWPTEEAVHKVVTTLVEAGWWEPVDDGWQIAEWHDFILSSDEVAKVRSSWRDRKERQRRHERDDHSMCDRCAAVRNKSRSESRRDTSSDSRVESRPSEPNRTEPKERGSERGAVAAVYDGPAAPPADEEPAPTDPPSDASAMRNFLRLPEAMKAAAMGKARAELGDDATDGAVLARAVVVAGEVVA
jgi:hypothetical protein